MCSICDEALTNLIVKELSHIGLFVPVSEIEASTIEAYNRVITTYNQHSKGIALNKNCKNEAYYTVLKNVVSAEIISKTRLANARNRYEAMSTLTLLQGYLDEFTNLVNIQRVNASDIFSHIINNLPFRIDGIKLLVNPGTPKSRLCSNCTSCSMQKCTEDLCFDELTVNIVYRNMCIGFRVDTGIFGLTEDTLLSPEYINNGAKVLTNISLAAHKEFERHSKEIFIELHKENLIDD